MLGHVHPSVSSMFIYQEKFLYFALRRATGEHEREIADRYNSGIINSNVALKREEIETHGIKIA